MPSYRPIGYLPESGTEKARYKQARQTRVAQNINHKTWHDLHKESVVKDPHDPDILSDNLTHIISINWLGTGDVLS